LKENVVVKLAGRDPHLLVLAGPTFASRSIVALFSILELILARNVTGTAISSMVSAQMTAFQVISSGSVQKLRHTGDQAA
jgi:hypothetical protein